jgi:hypothetical protein
MKSLTNSENPSRKLIPAFRRLPVSEIIERAACDSENCSEMYTQEREGKLEQLY